MHVGSFDWYFYSALISERFLVANANLNISVLTSRDLQYSWLEHFTNCVVAGFHKQHFIDTRSAFDRVGADVGQVGQDFLWVFALWVAPRFLLLPHTVLADSQRWVGSKKAKSSRSLHKNYGLAQLL